MKFIFTVFLTLSIFSLYSQEEEYVKEEEKYEKEWHRIDSLAGKSGLLRSALKEVNALYAIAKKDTDDVQAIRALLYRMSINDQLSEQGKYENISTLENEITISAEPARSILHSIAGSTYWHYLQLNRWQFYQRSTTRGYENNDIATWSLEQLYSRITAHFDSSLANMQILKDTALEYFDPVIIPGNTRRLRPTLFDLLAFRAIEYFSNDERYITRPSYAFEIRDSIAFADARTFANHKFVTSDSLSLHYKALKLYQQILLFHLREYKRDALIDADLNRLQFVRNFGTHRNKDELYRKGLESIISTNRSSEAITNPMFHLAEWHMEKGRSYDPTGDTSNRYSIAKAKELCERSLDINTRNEGATKCLNLLKEIEQQQISLKAEDINTRNEPFRVLVNYKNITYTYFRIIKLDRDVRDMLGRESWNDEYWKKVIALPAIKTYQFTLPPMDDYQTHRIEIKIDSLPSGEYGILASAVNDFSLANNPLSLYHIYVSDISFVSNKNKFHVLNRKSGAPLDAANVQVWEEYYNADKGSTDFREFESYTTDESGYFELKQGTIDNPGRNIFLDISYGDDRLFLQKTPHVYFYDPANRGRDSAREETILFTDRSLYRPGQTVYFKGILLSRQLKENKNKVIADRNSTVILYDNNEQAIDSIKLTTNDFGSYAGKFTLPQGLLNGEFAIRDDQTKSESRIRVEEYKRPKFYVEIASPKGTYRVYDTIRVKGNAKSYAGNNINAATVSYRVLRRALIPLWVRDYMPRIWPPYPQEQMEIAYGNVLTDENGQFNIAFAAIPDNKVPQSSHPIFYYEVSADVTDINGETRSATSTVNVGYEALKMELNLQEFISTDSLKDIVVSTRNMNDSFESADVHISMYKLAAPAKVFRERFWEQPDQFIMSKEEYYQNFPHDLYADENNKSKWVREQILAEISGRTTRDGKFNLEKKPAEGWYLAEAVAKDKYGNTVTDRKYVLVYDKNFASPEAGAKLITDKPVGSTGDKIHYNLLTNIESVYVIHELFRSGTTEKKIENTIKNAVRERLNIEDRDQGAIIAKTVFVKNNRVYADVLDIPVSKPDKQLKIDYISYRDKSLPGRNEKWKVKISGMNGDRVVAELLTSMYDASLDQFYPHEWRYPNIWSDIFDRSPWFGKINFEAGESVQRGVNEVLRNIPVKIYDRLKTPYEGTVVNEARIRNMVAEGARPPQPGIAKATDARVEFSKEKAVSDQQVTETVQTVSNKKIPPTVQPRKNFNETAFFFPDLLTDSSGSVEFSFTSPDALTTWNWKLFAHTRGLALVYGEKQIITQKQLMVQPNAPRFLREGDSIGFSVKVANMTNRPISGRATLQFVDPSTGKEVNGLIAGTNQPLTFNAPAGQSVNLSYKVNIPASFTSPLIWRVTAVSADNDVSLTDGEEDVIPVLSSRLLVTESFPLPVRGAQSKSFIFEKLLNSTTNGSLKNRSLTVEFTSNPAWYAIQTLPYLAEVKEESAEQAFNRFYSNAIASKLAGSFPRLRTLMDKWNRSDTSAFLSSLQKNQELKSVLLQETPWVLEAKTESQQKKNIALLFDMTKMSRELNSALQNLVSMQTASGGFVWFNGGPEDRYMTQYIISGIGHLKKLGAIPTTSNEQINEIVSKAIMYLDRQIKKEYGQIPAKDKKTVGTTVGYDPIQYLYTRSFFAEIAVPKDVFPAYNYFRMQTKQGWVKQNSYMRAMIALTMQRTADPHTAKKIMAALKETAIINEEMGMYWKDMTGGYYWYQAPVETQSLLIEAFSEITKDSAAVGDMKTWLLKNKQTNSWRSTKATADACYALLLQGDNWVAKDIPVTISLGEKTFSSANAEAGTGYFKNTIPGESVKPDMGNITINIQNSNATQPAWGAVHWQYFEDADKITSSTGALNINKKLFVQRNTDRGPVIISLDTNNTLHTGDRVKVRIEIRTDRSMEYVHLKDLRSSAMEPVNILSSYKWQGGLGYYESTKDASTNFYFSYLPKGTHVFEYDLFVTHLGKFNNGIASIQCMYAPEFNSHSEGIKVNVVNK